MIESFIVKNYMSYRDQVELSFLASKKEKASALPPEWYQEIDGKAELISQLKKAMAASGIPTRE